MKIREAGLGAPNRAQDAQADAVAQFVAMGMARRAGRTANGTWFTAYVDTGAGHTNCSPVFAAANHGKAAFSFGEDSTLVADCLFDEAVLYKPADSVSR